MLNQIKIIGRTLIEELNYVRRSYHGSDSNDYFWQVSIAIYYASVDEIMVCVHFHVCL